ncbi:MAG: PilC/PilY family type IV pilus protein [Solimonas sp.]
MHREKRISWAGACAAVLLAWLTATLSAQASVTIDQSPLTVSATVPPNIVLMLDDSGSMASDYMPDTLTDTSIDGFHSSSINGVYYDPATTYSPPYKADGTQYDAATFTAAWINGFGSTTSSSNITNLTTYSDTSNSEKTYSAAFSVTSTPTCSSGTLNTTSSTNAGLCVTTTTTTNCSNNGGNGLHGGGNSGSNCTTTTTTSPTCSTGTLTNSGKTSVTCTTTYNAFTYTVLSGSTYTRYYVATSSEVCSAIIGKKPTTSALSSAAAVTSATCLYDSTTQTNVANWFSYYHTRILMAKSGLMNAFASLDSTVRFGFGSINGYSNKNYSNLPSSRYSTTISSTTYYLANVATFGDGSSGTQKAYFWNWLVNATADSNTPLRQALNAVGTYYTSATPWQTSTSDATELACRQSYTILTTDGFWNDSSSGLSSSTYGSTNVDGTSTSVTRTGTNAQSYTYTAAAPYKDSYSDTLADVAMYYWLTDLRPDSDNEVPTSTEDPAFWQHMTTFTVGMGYEPTGISPSGTSVDDIFTWANGGTAISGFSWPQPSSNSVYNIADMAHAAVNGHGGFYSATSPTAFATALTDALARVTERIGSGASVAASSTTLETDTMVYQATYYTGQWYGDLRAFSIGTDGTVSTTASWKASTVFPAAASRTIYTWNPSSKTSIEFTTGNLSSLTSAQQTALGSTSTAQTAMISYLRGDSTNEESNGGSYRNRSVVALGDIVDSQPVYAGAPSANTFSGMTFTGSSLYETYVADNASRTALIWVAANDGMLHAFSASTGVEAYAYLPGAVITSTDTDGAYNLVNLANEDYGDDSVPHQYYNDGELTVADVYYSAAKGWRTVLVGTTGRGTAKAVYALDVTDPAAPTVLWERSSGDGLTNSGYIGQMIGKPVIAQTADGTWSVLIGNGYNSTKNTAALLQFAINGGALTVRTIDDTSTSNGLAAPLVWMDSSTDGISTRAYAGDLNGHVAYFDLSSSTSTGSTVFTATYDGAAQPITAGMLGGKDPDTGALWLFFGTGKYLTSDDLSDTSVQTWYGIIVEKGSSQSLSGSLASSGRDVLTERTITYEAEATDDTLAWRSISSATSGDMSSRWGWYIDLVSPTEGEQGERMVIPNEFEGSYLIGTTIVPVSSDPCSPSGSSWVMAIDPFTGTLSSSFFDIDGDGTVSTVTVDGVTYVVAGVGFSAVASNPTFVGNTMVVSFDNASTTSLTTASSTDSLERLSWRELLAQ